MFEEYTDQECSPRSPDLNEKEDKVSKRPVGVRRPTGPRPNGVRKPKGTPRRP